MQEASFTGFFRTLLTIFLIYYAIKIIARLFLPVVIQHTKNKVEEHLRQQQNAYQNQNNTTKTGETVIDKKPNTHSSNKNVEGEYIDYEEVK